jgi:hypothetical protein
MAKEKKKARRGKQPKPVPRLISNVRLCVRMASDGSLLAVQDLLVVHPIDAILTFDTVSHAVGEVGACNSQG